MSLATSSLSVNHDREISPAEKLVILWAKRTGQALTRQQLRALTQVLENNDVQDMDCLSWVLFGWNLGGESQLDEMINVVNSLQSSVSTFLATNEAFRKESCQLIKGLKVKLSQHAMAPKNQFLQPPIIPQPEQTLNLSGTLLTKEMSTSSVPSANVKTSGMPSLKSLLKRQAPMKAPAVPKAVPSVLSVNEKMAAIINSTVSGNFQDDTYSPEDVASFLAAMRKSSLQFAPFYTKPDLDRATWNFMKQNGYPAKNISKTMHAHIVADALADYLQNASKN